MDRDVAAWIRESRGLKLFVKLDDIMTPGIRRTRSVPQGDPCAADLFGAALGIPATAFFVKGARQRSGGLHGATAFRRQLLAHRDDTSRTQTLSRAWNELLEKAGLRVRVGRSRVLFFST